MENDPLDDSVPRHDSDPLEPAVRDAQAIADRIAADEAAADDERDRLHADRPLPLEPDAAVAAVLQTGEAVIATARGLALDGGSVPDLARWGAAGIHLTTRRLLLALASGVIEIRLADIEEAGVVGERLLVIAHAAGRELRLEMDRPRVFRVRLAHAAAAERATRTA